MLLVAVLGLVFSYSVVAAVEAANTNYQSAAELLKSLPPEHVPYFLYNNKRVAKQCRRDPRCPFKVRLNSQLVS